MTSINRLHQALEAIECAGGDNNLHQYWVAGEGLTKWVDTPHPWTVLYHHLLKYLDPDEAKRTAAKWYHEVKGTWPGSHHK